jgi:hypothetical protein
MSAHTPGPYIVVDAVGEEGPYIESEATQRTVADFSAMQIDTEGLATVRLFAAAPELLEALKAVDAGMDHALDCALDRAHAPGACSCPMRLVEAAIAKATGAAHG